MSAGPDGRHDGAVLTLYDNAGSSNALKVRFLLHELDADFTSVEVPLAEPRPGWYREIHPYGLVPCLVDGDLVIPESNTALRYLADRSGRVDLYPTAPASRARVDIVMDALSLQLRPALWEAEKIAVYDAPETEDVATPLAAALTAWESLLSPGGWCAREFSIADCAAAGRLMHIDRLPVDLDAFPRIAAMLSNVRARPAWRRALGD